MKIDVFYQGEGVNEVEHVSIEAEKSFADLKILLVEKHSLEGELLLFLEDFDEPHVCHALIGHHADNCGIKAHIHRTRKVDVSVRFNGKNIQHHFAPSATIGRVKAWACDDLGMSPAEATEHVLQLRVTHERPSPGVHLGSLVKHGKCHLSFDLVPDERVNG